MIAVVRFPASNCDTDCVRAVQVVTGQEPHLVWHEDALPADTGAVILPGGFSYGDYLRCGAIARFARVMADVRRFADNGGPVLGICNGFQVLTEAGLLPGALLPNESLHFVCRKVSLEVVSTNTLFTTGYTPRQTLDIHVAHGDGRYYVDAETLRQLEARDQIVFRYAEGDNPNGSLGNIAGICNERRNVLGMMPHPERVCDPILGGTDGAPIFSALHAFLQRKAVAAV